MWLLKTNFAINNCLLTDLELTSNMLLHCADCSCAVCPDNASQPWTLNKLSVALQNKIPDWEDLPDQNSRGTSEICSGKKKSKLK